jgi:glycosyltransferase involved in cell wall biosynthesis
VDKVFLKPRRDEPLRGVEVFNLMLMRDLCRLGYGVSLLCVDSWRETIAAELGEDGPGWVRVPDTGLDFLNAAVAGLHPRLPPADVLLVGNVGKSLSPLVWLLWKRGRFGRCVLIAHREATMGFARQMVRLPGHVVAVNSVIARPFRELGHPAVAVDYGVTNADWFYPALRPPDGLVHFVVMGMLDNAWKGADTAVAAFHQLPESLRDRCRLHLASYTTPPDLDDHRIHAYPWMPLADVPDFLRGMDVMLVPSRDEGVMRETFSQVVVQGMLTGLPVLVSDLMVLREKVDAGGGRVVADAAELSAHMAELAADAAKRSALGERARSVALERYVWDTARFARRYIQQEARDG